MLAGFAGLWLIDRHLYAVCPACSHTHNHESCGRQLHGFATPLLIAASLHSFFDGWSLAVSQQQGFESLRLAFLLGIGVHKLPEGLALGATVAQSLMLAGGILAVFLAPHMGVNWTIGFLAVAAGAFVYLGYHAIDSEYQQRGVATTVMPALAGAVGAAALRVVVPGL